MKKMHRRSFVIAGLLMAFSIALFSFKTGRGGDSFTIYLNNKLVLQQYVYADKSVKTISLSGANPNDELRVSYSHCGTVGKKRVLTIKDKQNKILKQFSFADGNDSMTCKVKDIPGLTKESAELSLVYSSAEMPGGHVLASLVIRKENKTTLP